jgi:F-type H+-transporting ATPase subunit c
MGANGLIAIAAGMAAMTGIGAGIGIGLATGKAAEAVARQPEADGKITKNFVLGIALAEATAIYGLIVALLLMFTKMA